MIHGTNPSENKPSADDRAKTAQEGVNDLMSYVGQRLEKAKLSGRTPIEEVKKDIATKGPIFSETAAESEKATTDKKINILQNGKEIILRLWKSWGSLCDKLPQPWNQVTKIAAPILASTVGAIWLQTFVQLGIAGAQLFGGFFQPLLGTAACLAPAFIVDPALKLCEKLFKLQPLKSWQKAAISIPVKGLAFLGAGLWVNSLDLTPVSYSLYAAGAVVCGAAITKVLGKANRAVWTSVLAAVALPWAHALSTRSYDVTVKSVSADPEVAAWNIGTDLSVRDHWRKLLFLAQEAPPSGGPGMVLLNKDVPLYLPPHREANVFNAEFQSLIGKKVRVTTVGSWLKPLSAHSQPVIVKFQPLE
jgi:hypothetical protein